MTLKVTDNQYGRVGYPSDSWASCWFLLSVTHVL